MHLYVCVYVNFEMCWRTVFVSDIIIEYIKTSPQPCYSYADVY